MLYDISQNVFGCRIYHGDSQPVRRIVNSIDTGSLYNLTEFSMCAHNGTHIDAPLHFINGSDSVENIPLEVFFGPAYVYTHSGNINAEDAAMILNTAAKINQDASKRILIKGAATVTEEAAEVFASSGMLLVGNESQTVGPENAPMAVHLILLDAGIVLLEGVVLDGVRDGVYLLSCALLSLTELKVPHAEQYWQTSVESIEAQA